MAITVFGKTYVTIAYDEDKKLLATVWHGFANSKEYREVLDFVLDFFHKHIVYYSFSDSRDMKAIHPADQQYTNDHFMPGFFKVENLKKSAVIISEDIFNRMAVEAMTVKANEFIKFDMKYFSTKEMAMAWLMENVQ
jgi:hypothetical protein